MRLWVHGVIPGQRLQIDINGKRIGEASLLAEWKQIVIKVPAGRLRRGENQLRLYAAKVGSIAGKKSYGLYRALELVPGQVEAAVDEPALSPVAELSGGTDRKLALTGFARMVLFVEIPPQAHLEFWAAPVSSGRYQISVRPVEGEVRRLLEVETGGKWQHQTAALSEFANQLVALEFIAPAQGGFAGARLALERAAERPRRAPYKNAVLFVVDALRSDRLAVYGKTRVATPRTTAEAGKRGVVFLHNQAASCSSPPSHASIQTGMIPRVHGVVGDTAQLLPGTPTISTQLGAGGRSTGD
jgi:hypothetical protein